MTDSSKGNTSYMAFGFLFTLIAVVALIALILTNSSADNVSSTGTIGNASPTITNLTISTSTYGTAASPVALTAGTTTTVYVNGTGNDNNGCGQIDKATGTGASLGDADSKWEGVLYRTSIGSQTCTPSNTNCYTITTADADLASGSNLCTDASGGSDLSTQFEFDVPLQFFADATDTGSSPDLASTNWTAWVKVTDDWGGTGTASTTTDVSTTNGLTMVTGSITYPSTALGAESSEQTVTLTNTGNNNTFDPYVSMSADWSCTIGSIVKGNTKWSVLTEGAQTSLTTSPAAINLDIAKSTGTGSNGSFYTKLTIPSTGVGGSCTSTLVVGAST